MSGGGPHGVIVVSSSTKAYEQALIYVRDGRVKPMIVETRLEGIDTCLQALEKGEVEGQFVAAFGIEEPNSYRYCLSPS